MTSSDPPTGPVHRSGLVTGQVVDAPADATDGRVAINGVVVGGSKLSTDSDGRDGRIAVLLPQGVLEARERRSAPRWWSMARCVELEVTGS